MHRVAAVVVLLSSFFAVSPVSANGPLEAAMKAERQQNIVQVQFAKGDSIRGKVHSRTSSIRLWLEIESHSTVVVMPLKWSNIKSIAPVKPVAATTAKKRGSQAERAHALLFDAAGK